MMTRRQAQKELLSAALIASLPLAVAARDQETVRLPPARTEGGLPLM